jgi:hypothetical protein
MECKARRQFTYQHLQPDGDSRTEMICRDLQTCRSSLNDENLLKTLGETTSLRDSGFPPEANEWTFEFSQVHLQIVTNAAN